MYIHLTTHSAFSLQEGLMAPAELVQATQANGDPMATTAKDEALIKAADLTAKQLQQAIDIVEGKVGKERAESDGALVGAVLDVLAMN
jgi:DNA polymerase III alpha subunit